MGFSSEDKKILAAANQYTEDITRGITMIEGKPCTIASITDITGGHRVTYRWTANDGTTKTQTMDVMDGVQGPQGVKGDTGNTGATGAQGPAGADGTSATIRVGNVTSGATPTITNSGTNLNAVFDFVLPKGDKGDKGDKGEDGQNGSSFSIRSRFATYEELIAAYPDGPENEGDAYFGGTTASPDLYIWLVDEHEWHNNGPIAGVKGDKGDQGDEGFSPVANVTKDGGVATITIRDKTGTTTQQVSDGADGDDGQDGADGKSAYDIAVDEGFVGTKAEWLASLKGETGAAGTNGTNGTDGVSPVANVTKTDDVIKIHIEDSTGTTEEEIDMSDYQKKDLASAVEGQTTVEGALGALSTNKADKVSGATNGNFAGLDASGNLVDSGKKASDFGTADEIADIVNVYGSKNLMETTVSSHTQNGITKTVNADGSFTLNGTATKNTYFYWIGQTQFPTENIQYTYSIETSAVWGIGQAIAGIDKRSETAYIDRYKSIYADGTTHIEGTFTGESGYYAWAWIFIPNGTQLTNVIVKGMIRLASIKDDTFVPYAKTNGALTIDKAEQAEVNDIVNVLGAKNLLPYPYKNTTTTINGITFTDNGDGTITANGTATELALFRFKTRADANFTLNKARYIYTGCPAGGSTSTYLIDIGSTTGGFDLQDVGNGVVVVPTADNCATGAAIRIFRGTTVNNLIFKPMLRLASDPDDTYQPYAMTNRELTEKILEKKVLTSADDLNDVMETGLYVIRDGIPTNSPENTNWCSLLVNNVSDNNVQQQLFKGEYLYQRKYSGVSPTWGSWYKFTGTVVS